MALKREYYPSDTLKLINTSESLVVRNKIRGNASTFQDVDDKYFSHTIGRHLLKGTPGSRGLGIQKDEFRDRFLNAPDNVNSGWAGKGEMAILLCELLNSDAGQYALGLMDRGIGRVVVHYLNEGKLANLTYGAKLQESRVTVTPASVQVIQEALINRRTNQPVLVNGVQKIINKSITIPKQSVAQIKANDIATVNAVLDCFGNKSLHLQTFFPSSEAVTSYVEWSVGPVRHVGTFDKGTVNIKILPCY
ncbi:MAG: hypothetical protein KAQ91_08830 [Methylococcales bacterium]|nr:hypothetical protein [Methylococcales bacterium]